ALHVREQWAPQFPRAAQMPSVPDLTRARERLDNDDPPPPWLKPEHRIIPPAIMRCRQRASRRWQNGILIAFIISVCVPPMAYYFVGGRQSSSETHRQAASIVTKPAVPLASLNAQILAQDDEAEPLDANQSASPAKPSRAAGFSERLAMVKPEDADVGPMSPRPVVRFLDADAITLLMKQGEQLVETGDFAAARTLFQRAAEAE